jgi:hypothetical protein
MVWNLTVSKSFDHYLQRWSVTGVLKTQITLRVTLAVTLASDQVPKEQAVAYGATINLAAGKTLCWAGATPLLYTVLCPK